MVNFIDIYDDTNFTFYLIRNRENKYVEIWMKYKNNCYSPLFLMESGIRAATINKLLSLNMCNNYITWYVYKSVAGVSVLENNPNIIQTISITRSNITVKFIR